MNRSLGFLIGTAGLLGGAGAFLAVANCGNTTAMDMPDMTVSSTAKDVTAADVKGGNDLKFAFSKLLLPGGRTDYAIDLNGDGNKDNQLGNIIGALAAQNLDAQKGVDDSVTAGSVVLLMDLTTADASAQSDSGVKVTIYIGKSFKSTVTDGGVTGGPDFSGAGMFTVDGTAPKGEFFGKLVGGKLTTNNPVTTASPVKISLKLALIAGADAVELSLNGAQVQGAVSATGVMTGELHGSIKAADIQSNIVPAVAKLLTKQITDNPLSPSTGQIKSIFDTGGDNGMCTNPDNTMAKGGDGKIDICEVAQNSIIKNVLAPDIQVYDAMGNYAPNKANTKRDSLSFGVGFTAVKGGFTP